MKIDKILYSSITPVLIATILLIAGLRYGDFTLQRHNKGKVTNNFLSTKVYCSRFTPKNLYPESTGKFAGFEWSMLGRGSGDCDAYNQPFIDGCMEYVRQEKSYNDCLYDPSGIKTETKPVRPILLKTCFDKLGTYCLDGL